MTYIIYYYICCFELLRQCIISGTKANGFNKQLSIILTVKVTMNYKLKYYLGYSARIINLSPVHIMHYDSITHHN